MADSQPQEPNRPDRSAAATDGDALLLCGARLADGRTVDVRVAEGRIQAVGTAGSLIPTGTRPAGARIDLTGYLLLPAPAEPHAHLGTAFTGDRQGPPGDEGPEVQRRATEAALLQLGHGATAARTHVRIGDVNGLTPLEAVLSARRSLQGLAELGTVAVPRLLTGTAGAGQLAMLRDALKVGADVIGGCPDLDPDPCGYTETVLDLAAEHGCAVDLHTEADDAGRISRLAAMAGGLRQGVVLGPCGGLNRLPQEAAHRAADQLAAAGVGVVALPQGGCGLMGRRTPERTAPVRLLSAAGVPVTAGSGALRDAANPVGRGDPLEAAYLLASLGEATAEEAYAMVSTGARTALGLPEVRVEAGFPAELLAVRGQSVAGVLSLAYSRIVLHRGRVVTRTSAVREFCDVGAPDSRPGGAGLGLPRQSQG